MKLLRPFLPLVFVVVLCGLFLPGSSPLLGQSAQSAVPRWQIDAGGKMAFDVASVKPNKSGGRAYSNVLLIPGTGAVYSPTGGLFSAANYPLITYMAFAYDMTGDQALQLGAQLPSWVTMENFDIEARAEGNPTKDQMRLMMQSLLADRFKLVVHTETKQGPVYALVLSKPGKTGPQLQPHLDNASCSTAQLPPTGTAPPSTVATAFPAICGGILRMQPSAPGRARAGARNVTMGLIATTLSRMGIPDLGRPVLDQTGLSGTFDFAIEWTPQLNGPLPPGTDFQPDPDGPAFLQALQEQLGLKLEPTTGPADAFVVDHLEEPSPN